jgi:hypothetical protein
MARTVVLTFNDNDAAAAFIEGVLTAQDPELGEEQLATEIMATGAIVSAMAKIDAVIARPTRYCRCRIVGMTQWARENRRGRVTSGKFIDTDPLRPEYISQVGRHIKTKRFGWLVHDKCNKPGQFVVQRFIQNMLIGIGCNNLLDEYKTKIREERIKNYVAPDPAEIAKTNAENIELLEQLRLEEAEQEHRNTL